MRFSSRLAYLLIGILGLSVVAAPLVKIPVDWLLHIFPETSRLFGLHLAQGSYDFGRVYRRILLFLTLALGYLARRRLGPVSVRGVGVGSRPGWQFGSGLMLGIFSFGIFLVLLVILGERSIMLKNPDNWPGRIALAFGSGLLVGIIEETIFRGFLLGGFLLEWSSLLAVLLSSTLFSAVHFLHAKIRVTSGLDLDVGLQALLAHFHPLARSTTLFPFIGLFLVGVVLAYAYIWTDSLPFAIGLHAGWVFLAKIDGLLLRERSGIEWLYGQQGILAGIPGWAFLLLMLPVLRLWIHLSSSSTRARRA